MIRSIYSEVPEILEASRIYNDALADDATRYRALSREKFLRDELSRKVAAFEEGEAKGKAEGLAEGKAEGKIEGLTITARNLKAEGFDLERIAKLTGLDITDIEKL